MNQHQGQSPDSNAVLKRNIMTGWWVFAALIVLSVLEYLVAVATSKNLPIMIVMNIADAALILIYFMHVARAWRAEED